jgi:hypothetical protein
MRRMARRLGASHMRAMGAIGGVVACAGAGVAVAASPKPPGAPLTPPVDTAVAADRSTPAATPCTTVVDQLASTVQQLRAATTRAQRQEILRGLTPDQRQQATAMLRDRSGGATPSAGCGAAQPEPMIQPDVVDAAPGGPAITNSYVS